MMESFPSIFALSAADNALTLAKEPRRPSFSGVKKMTEIGRFDPGVAVRLPVVVD